MACNVVLVEQVKSEYCYVTLDEVKYQTFLYAVQNHYWYQMYIDDLPIWGNNMLSCWIYCAVT